MTDTEYVKIFNACSIQNVQEASRVYVYFPLPDLSRKIERDSARRVPYYSSYIEVREKSKGILCDVYQNVKTTK